MRAAPGNGSFELQAEQPTVTVEATNTKNRKQSVLALNSEVARRLAVWLAARGPQPADKPLFAVTNRRHNGRRKSGAHSGAQHGALRVASTPDESAAFCNPSDDEAANDATLQAAVASDYDSPQVSASCNNGRGGDRTRTPVTRYGILSPVQDSPKQFPDKGLRKGHSSVAPTMVPCESKTAGAEAVDLPALDPDQARLVAAWLNLSPADREVFLATPEAWPVYAAAAHASIVAIVRAPRPNERDHA
jgi:hypothetical protein